MKILIHGINYAPEQIGIGKYTGEMAAWLAQQGHIVRVVTAPPYYPDWRIRREYTAWEYRRERINGVDVFRCPLWVPRSPSGITRIIHLASFAFFSFPVMLRHVWWRPDVVLVVQPPLFCAPQAWMVARLSGAKSWQHVQDFEVAAFFGLGFASSGFIKRIVTGIEGWLMRRFDRVSSISNAMVDRLAHLKVSRDRTYLFPNWVDARHIRPNSGGRTLRFEWGIAESRVVILYSGNMGKKQGLEIVLESASELEQTHPEVLFVLVGEGAAKTGLRAEAENRKLSNVIFQPLLPLNKLPSLLNMANIHLVIQKRGVADAVMPSKLTGILAAGGYSVITADEQTELGRFVAGNPGIAVLAEPENKNDLKRALVELLSRQRISGRYNSVARTYAEQHLDTERVLADLEQELLKVGGGKEKGVRESP